MENLKANLIDFLKTLAISILIVFIINNFLFMPVKIDGDSMYPNLQDQEICLSGIVTKLFGYDRFDIVILRNDHTQNRIVKRIIGMPNEIVEYKNNKLYINGEYVEEEFLSADVYTDDFRVELGEDEYFCLGDNRNVSRDSRYYGAFKEADVDAKGIFVLLPFSQLGFK